MPTPVPLTTANTIQDMMSTINNIIATTATFPAAATNIADGSVSNSEFQYLDGVTSAIQTQLNTGATNLTNNVATLDSNVARLNVETANASHLTQGLVATARGGLGNDASSANGVVLFNGSTAEYQALLTHERGGLELDMATANGFALVSNGTTTMEALLPHNRGGLGADVLAYAGRISLASGTTTEIKDNLAASVAPAITDDSGSGYGVRSEWVITSGAKAGALYICADPAAGAAVWHQVGAGGGYNPIAPKFITLF